MHYPIFQKRRKRTNQFLINYSLLLILEMSPLMGTLCSFYIMCISFGYSLVRYNLFFLPLQTRCPSEVNFLGQEGPWLCPWAPSPGSLQHVGAAPLDCRLSWPRCVGAGKACPQTCAARMPLGQRLPPSQRAGPGWLRSFWFSCRLTHEYVLIFVPALPVSATVCRAGRRLALSSPQFWLWAFPPGLLGRPISQQRLPTVP